METKKNLLEKIADNQGNYYSALFNQESFSPKAVGSTTLVDKWMRYEKLSGIFADDHGFSVHDVGHGLGHYLEYLRENFREKDIIYSGSEICSDFVDFCREKYPQNKFYLRNLAKKPFPKKYDYLVYGGTFYHITKDSKINFERYVKSILLNGFKSCKRGMAFNFITQYCDYFDNRLYHCDIHRILDFIVKNMSRFFVLNHGYPLYEFTIFVYHPRYIKKMYPQPQMKKYLKK